MDGLAWRAAAGALAPTIIVISSGKISAKEGRFRWRVFMAKPYEERKLTEFWRSGQGWRLRGPAPQAKAPIWLAWRGACVSYHRTAGDVHFAPL